MGFENRFRQPAWQNNIGHSGLGPQKPLLPGHVSEAVFQKSRVNFPIFYVYDGLWASFIILRVSRQIRFAYGRALERKEGL